MDNRYDFIESGENIEIYKDGKIFALSSNNPNLIYNTLSTDFAVLKKIQFKKNDILIKFYLCTSRKNFSFPLECYSIKIGAHIHKPIILKSSNEFEINDEIFDVTECLVRIPYSKLTDFGRVTQVTLFAHDKNHYGLTKVMYWSFPSQKLSYEDTLLKNSRSKRITAHTYTYFRQSSKNGVSIVVREKNTTDSFFQNFKIDFAYLLAKVVRKFTYKDVILLYEKWSMKYEESASIIFEELIKNWKPGMKKIYYIIDKKSDQYSRIPKQYSKHILRKYSIKHYFYFFFCRTFLGTEQIVTCIDSYVKNPCARQKILQNNYHFIFLQHGVYYMYGLDKSISFMYKGKGFPKYGKIVCSSETEGRHFTEYANFDRNDLIITGLPKFDRSVRNNTHDKIVIMPTYRKWELNEFENDVENTTYYKFMFNIFSCIPDSLKDKVIILPHPLLNQKFYNTKLGKYIPRHFVYDDILKETELLITDWSSISYDAFYRGTKIIFCWEEKDECIQKFGTRLMLNDDNVFSDVSYSFSDLEDLVTKNYYGEQSPEHIKRFKDIVSHSDGKNSKRLVKVLLDENYLYYPQGKDISELRLEGLTKKLYTGKELKLYNLDLFDGNYRLAEGIDYVVKYSNNIEVGQGNVEITGIGKYYGTIENSFLIRRNAKEFTIKGIVDKKYSGKKIYQQLDVSYDGTTLVKGIDYVIKYENNIERGIATVRVCGRTEKYGGEQRLYFKIN